MRWVGACGRGRDTPKMEKLEIKLYRVSSEVLSERREEKQKKQKQRERKKENKIKEIPKLFFFLFLFLFIYFIFCFIIILYSTVLLICRRLKHIKKLHIKNKKFIYI